MIKTENKTKNLKFYIWFFAIILFCVLFDQLTKIWTVDVNVSIIPNFFSFYYTKNTGVAFSFLSGKSWIFIPISLCAVIGLLTLFVLTKRKNYLLTVGFSLVCAGAVGNLIDRIFLGFVRDFISFHFFPAIFNFADVCITIGTIIIMIYLVFFFGKEKKIETKL